MVDLSKYTITIEQNDALDFVATVKEYPNIRIVEDSYKAAYNGLVDTIIKTQYETMTGYIGYDGLSAPVCSGTLTIDELLKHECNMSWHDAVRSGYKPVNGTSQEEYQPYIIYIEKL